MNIPYLPVQSISLQSSTKIESFEQSGFATDSIETTFRSESSFSIKQKILNAIFSRDNIRQFMFWVIIIQWVIFLVGKSISYTSKTKYICVLYDFGASYTPAVKVLNQYYRLILPVFLHLNFWHIFFNTMAQITFCWSLEESLKTKMFTLVYFATGLGGILLSENASTKAISVGASSAIYGTFGFELSYVFENYSDLGPRRRNYTVMLFMYVFNGLVHSGAHVDFYGHMGGFITGLLISLFYLRRKEYFGIGLSKIKVLAGLMLIGFYVGLFWRIMAMKGLRRDALGMENKCEQ